MPLLINKKYGDGKFHNAIFEEHKRIIPIAKLYHQ